MKGWGLGGLGPTEAARCRSRAAFAFLDVARGTCAGILHAVSHPTSAKASSKPHASPEPASTRERLRVGRDGTIQIRAAGARTWETTSLRRLARDYAADHPFWRRLRRRGFRRPSSSGPTVPESQRKRAHCSLRLAPEEIARLDALASAWGVTRSQAVMRLLATAVPSSQVCEIIEESG